MRIVKNGRVYDLNYGKYETMARLPEGLRRNAVGNLSVNVSRELRRDVASGEFYILGYANGYTRENFAVTPVARDQAAKIAEDFLDYDEYVKFFGDPEGSDARRRTGGVRRQTEGVRRRTGGEVSTGTEPVPRPETGRSPAVFFVLCEDGNRTALLGTLYAEQLPSSDLSRFRLWDDGEGFDVFFKLRGRWHRVDAAWRQLKGRDLDPAENRPVAVTTFGRKVLGKYGVRKWKPKK